MKRIQPTFTTNQYWLIQHLACNITLVSFIIQLHTELFFHTQRLIHVPLTKLSVNAKKLELVCYSLHFKVLVICTR